jgi:hypothetical protein
MQTQLTFWQTFAGVIIKPFSTLQRLQKDGRSTLKGLLTLLLVLAVYTLIARIEEAPGTDKECCPSLSERIERSTQLET